VATKPQRGSMSKDEYMKAYVEFNRGQTAVWSKAIRAHPDVIRFLARGNPG
jgi:hypothetical protein